MLQTHHPHVTLKQPSPQQQHASTPQHQTIQEEPALISKPPVVPLSVRAPSPPQQQQPQQATPPATVTTTIQEPTVDKITTALKKSTLNPNAKEFNPNAKPFTPVSFHGKEKNLKFIQLFPCYVLAISEYTYT